jgi:hypothetical protein
MQARRWAKCREESDDGLHPMKLSSALAMIRDSAPIDRTMYLRNQELSQTCRSSQLNQEYCVQSNKYDHSDSRKPSKFERGEGTNHLKFCHASLFHNLQTLWALVATIRVGQFLLFGQNKIGSTKLKKILDPVSEVKITL